MDKYEYKVRADEIKRLVTEGDYAAAMEICDTIDWNRVKSVMMLCTVSDIYKINRRYEDSKNILLLAYDRHPGGRQIVYSLCELSIKLEEYVQAIEYYKEYAQLAPKDAGLYILLYKLYEAQDASLDERIDTLKKLKEREYKEKWAYELAYLYHRNGNVTDCIDECDELILWFGEGKYVMKAMELKMLHAALTPDQQAKYDLWTRKRTTPEPVVSGNSFTKIMDKPADQAYFETPSAAVVDAPTTELPSKEIDIHVKTMDVGQYNTINLQKALAESMKEVLPPEQPRTEAAFDETDVMETQEAFVEGIPMRRIDPDASELFFEDKTGELAPVADMEAAQEVYPTPEAAPEIQPAPEVAREVFPVPEAAPEIQPAPEVAREVYPVPEVAREIYPAPEVAREVYPETDKSAEQPQSDADKVMQEMKRDWTNEQNGFDQILSQEYDGQIRLVVPETEHIEKQITGQMSIADIMAEWERMKKENEKKRAEDVRRHVLEQTGNLFKDFEISSKSGLLEQLDAGLELEDVEPQQEPAPQELTTQDDLTTFALEDMDTEDEAADTEPQEITEEEEVVISEPQEITEEEEAVNDEAPEAASPDEDVSANAGEEATVAPEQEEAVASEQEEVSSEQEVSASKQETADSEEEAEAPVSSDEENMDDDDEQEESEESEVRDLTPEEKELFGRFIQNKKSRLQIIQTLDKISLAAYTGNVIITGDEGTGTMKLAKNLIREVQVTDHNFSGRVAKIGAVVLNKKDIPETLSKLVNGALIIQNAGSLSQDAVKALCKTLDTENNGIIILLEGTRRSIERLLDNYPQLLNCFNTRIDIEALGDDALVTFGKKYAYQMEYAIDDMGTLALHTRISDMQTADHAVTIYEVRDIIDEAIEHADRKSVKHFFDILFGKRYDAEDMVILREQDFIIK